MKLEKETQERLNQLVRGFLSDEGIVSLDDTPIHVTFMAGPELMPEKMNISIGESRLFTVRTANALHNEGLGTIGDVFNWIRK